MRHLLNKCLDYLINWINKKNTMKLFEIVFFLFLTEMTRTKTLKLHVRYSAESTYIQFCSFEKNPIVRHIWCLHSMKLTVLCCAVKRQNNTCGRNWILVFEISRFWPNILILRPQFVITTNNESLDTKSNHSQSYWYFSFNFMSSFTAYKVIHSETLM